MHPLPFFRSRWLLLLVVGFLIIFISVYTFQFLAERNKQKQAATVTPSPSISTPTPPPAGGPTANWKTYTNRKFNYSIKYPATTMTALATPDLTGLYKEENHVVSVDLNKNTTEGYIIVSVHKQKSNETLDSLKEEKLIKPNLVAKSTSRKEIEDGIKIFTLDNNPAVGGWIPGYLVSYLVYTIKNNFVYTIIFAEPLDPEGEFGNLNYDQILSTFKFTNLD